MKEKLIQAKEWINKNRKKSIGIIAGLLVIIAAVGLGVWGVNNSQASENKAAASSSVDNDKKSTNNKSTEKQETEKKETEIVEEDQSTVTAETEAAQQSQENTVAASSTQASSSQSSQDSNSSSSSASSKKPTHTHNYNIPIYASKDVYVVDRAAWTETVEEPVYTTVEVPVGNQSGKEISGDPNEYLLNNSNGDTGWHNEVKKIQTGTTTRTINHPEQGHYETESYVSGYKCSCGSTK